ncbi:MAG: PAS domain-containing protein, partial [Polyangiales bacterium]
MHSNSGRTSANTRPTLGTQLSQALDEGLLRTGELRASWQRAPAVEPAWITRALREIDFAYEELRMASEELREQADALASSRAAVEEEQQRYRALMDAVPDAYLVTTKVGILLEVNPRAVALLNLKAELLQGTPISLFVARSDRAAVYKALRTASAGVCCQVPLQVVRHGQAEPLATIANIARIAQRSDDVALSWILQRVPEVPLVGPLAHAATAARVDPMRELRAPLAACAARLAELRDDGGDESERRRTL